MTTAAWVFAIVIVALGAAVVWLLLQRRDSQRLQARFGPEYERAVRENGTRRGAERELESREKRVEALDIRPLPESARARFHDEWQGVQSRFVDAPAESTAEADRLVAEVMRERGYPVGDFEQRAADVSVDHPHVVEHYRAAREIAVRSGRGEATTEELRQGMVHYRALFEDLLENNAEVRIERA